MSAPEILWAQRSSEEDAEKNVVMVTINVPNLPPSPATKLDLKPTGFTFHSTVEADKAKGIQPKEYKFDLQFFDEVDVENSKVAQTSKSLYLVLRKKDKKLEYWPRLSKDKVRLHNVKTDFDKWVDEDEQDANMDDVMDGMGGMDPGMMAQTGGMGGMGGMPGMGGGGGAGGMGGMGGMDLQAMMAQLQGGAGGGLPDFGAEEEVSDLDDEEGEGEGEGEGEAKEESKTQATEGEKKSDVENVD